MPENGILLVNLGTPQEPTRKYVGRFLAEFLSDPRVVDLPRWWWIPLLRCLIIPLRRGKTSAAYREIWMDGGSPLLVYSRGLAQGVQDLLRGKARVGLAMRYGMPDIHGQLASLRDAGVSRLIVLPLYPQYSLTTTESVFDAVQVGLAELDWQPEMLPVMQYFDNPGWIHSVASSIRNFQLQHGKAEKVLFSMHGIPARLTEAGDPYEQQCRQSVEALSEVLQIQDQAVLAYQSRVGREQWLQPYTDDVIRDLAEQGVRYLQVISPGFAADCLETLEEISIRYRDLFIRSGGEKFEYIPALNDSAEHAAVLASMCENLFERPAPADALEPVS
ncbi:MAG: ferrochelatase [Xanthomonadales bacterium]|nr:ferrochelatase [Xanthomonadales bacterium]